MKWRDWDPQQYYNWRAYLDFGGGQVTDLFTHWIDVVHMFLGQDVPKSAAAAGGVYAYKDGRTAPDTINVLLEYPTDLTATFDDLYGGRGNWTVINSLAQMPEAVGQRIANLMQRIR